MRVIPAVALIALVWSHPTQSEESEPRCILPSEKQQDGPERDEVAGYYRSVSESEWNLEVRLRADGTAEVLWEAWTAGHYDERTNTRYRGSWVLSGSSVELRYHGLCETLRFDPALSFSEFGAKGAAPGLHGEHSSVSQNLFIGVSLWSVEQLRKLPDPG